MGEADPVQGNKMRAQSNFDPRISSNFLPLQTGFGLDLPNVDFRLSTKLEFPPGRAHMRRFALGLLVVSALGGAVFLSQSTGYQSNPKQISEGFQIQVEEKNPFTGLKPNAAPEQFQFAIISDRTGSHRPGVFSKAVQQINLLQPEFVMSVGDLIEGSQDPKVNREQWNEFNSYTSQFQMPFFYVTGNHDSANAALSAVWKEKYGRKSYHFTYKNCLFITLNTNDEAGDDPKVSASFRKERLGKEQLARVAGAIRDNPNVLHTFVFLHHPIWNAKDTRENGWDEFEELLGDKATTIFCGHIHTFRKFVRKGRNLYQLATTGGGSAMRGVEYGEFDQVAWVTVKNSGPVISHINLDGIYKEDLSPFESTEPGRVATLPKELTRVYGTATLRGKPAEGLLAVFTEIPEDPKTKPYSGNARTTKKGSFEVYAERGAPGLKPGKYKVHFVPAPPLVIDPAKKTGENPVPERFRSGATTPLVIEVPKGDGTSFTFNLE